MEVFNKFNHVPNDSLLKEAKGLETLQQLISKEGISELKIPKIVAVNSDKLSLEKINTQKASPIQYELLGKGLAKLHKASFKSYGLSYDNYIGLNPQKNQLSQNWGAFFVDMRLMLQIELIEDEMIRKYFKKVLINNRFKLINFLNATNEQASLVHGDLWSGNVLFDKESIYLIDPAIYFADREVDIAMTELFGGFSKEFYTSYHETLPLSDYYEEKKIIYNLYHYLNHYNLFGTSYLSTCEEGIKFIEKT